MRPRDSQRAKLYEAERALPTGQRYTTVAECQAFIDSVLDRKLVQRHYPNANTTWRVEVRDGRGHTHATGNAYTGIIQAPTWARTQRVLLHELAHVLTPVDSAHHGWEFAACLAFLARQVMGIENEAKLLAAFKANKVRYRKPKAGRTLTPEQREAATARLAAVRERRKGVDVGETSVN
jgi:putative metallohydrolase (TIGR04338 family)